MAEEEEKSFEEIEKEVTADKDSIDFATEKPKEEKNEEDSEAQENIETEENTEKEQEESLEEENQDTEVEDTETTETEDEETEKSNEELEETGSLQEDIEAEFPNQEVSENEEEDTDKTAEGDSEEEAPPPPAKPWIDFKAIDLKSDAKNLFKKPFYIIVLILGILLLVLFGAMFFEYRAEEYAKELEGYVKRNYKAPEWHEGELPENLKEVIHNYHLKKKKEIEKLTIIHPDPKAKQPIIGRNFDYPISNITLLAILRDQDIGQVTEEGVVKTELMNLSGLNMSKINYKYFRNMVAANLRYTSFSHIEEEGLMFRGASLQYSQFVEAVIPKTNFVRAKLSFSNFFEAIADGSYFNNVIAEKAQFSSSRMVSCNFNNVVFLKSDFSDAILDGITSKYSNWEGSNFSESSLIGANFKDANLKGVSFVAADLRDVNFEGANLEGANFEGANLRNTNFKNADVAQVNFLRTRNVSFNQLNQAKFLLSAKSIPPEIVPKKKSWKERFIVPNDSESMTR